ncbi:hypothetical protein [Bittarella sp. HCP28S3_D9]|uniref:hypothetical protein n=1 Tax=Bittarella sp. HCP28S3_D9 TaxID=3440253 RepID=UPI003F8B3D08
MKKHLIALLCLTLALLVTGCGEKSEAFSFPEEGREYIDTAELPRVYADPAGYRGKHVKLVGRAISMLERHTGESSFLFIPEGYSSPIAVHSADSSLQIEEGDILLVDGKFWSTKNTGTDLPHLAAADLTHSAYKDAFRPTLKEISLALTQVQEGCSVTVEKVEFAKEETRLYLRIQNTGGASISYWNGYLVQGGPSTPKHTTPRPATRSFPATFCPASPPSG